MHINKRVLAAVCTLVIVAGLAATWLHAATPTVGPLTANPAYVVVNTSTNVMLAVQITDPSLIQGSVNLLKVDPSGKTLATVGVMHDDGLSGDGVGGDKTFSFRITVNQAALGNTYYRASAAFKGALQRALSGVVTVTVDPFRLPPDPGEAGKLTLEGVDTDRNGVRDDVQRYIAYMAPTSGELRGALTQLAVSNQDFIGSAEAPEEILVPIVERRHKAQQCLYSVLGNGQDLIEAQHRLKSQLLNTSQRSLAYVRADRRLSGVAFPPPGSTSAAGSCGS